MRLRIAVVTGGRADYGLLFMPMRRLARDNRFDLRVIVTGQHLGPSAPGTLREIIEDGFRIDETVDILTDSDTALATCKATGLATIGLAEALSRQAPDLVLLLGDRYEILAAALAAHLLRLPIAHIAGGDVTEGAVDDALRHSITKLSHLHFVTSDEAARRVRQLGEDPARIHVVGSPGLDRICAIAVPGREDFFQAIAFAPRDRNLLVTFHPATAEDDSVAQVEELLAAFDAMEPKPGLIFTGVNADTEGRSLERVMRVYCRERASAQLYETLGASLYFSALQHCDAIVGNSSSGLYEAPSFKIPTVNIGTRQSGRLKATSVIDVTPERQAIRDAITRAFTLDCSAVVNPYGDGRASERIVERLAGIGDPRSLLHKRFRDFPARGPAYAVAPSP